MFLFFLCVYCYLPFIFITFLNIGTIFREVGKCVAERNLKQNQFKAGLNVHDHIMLYRLCDYNPCIV